MATTKINHTEFGRNNPEPSAEFTAYLDARIVASNAILAEQEAFNKCFQPVCQKKTLPMSEVVKIPCSQFNVKIGERFQTQHHIYVRIA